MWFWIRSSVVYSSNKMSQDDEIVMRDVTSAGICIGDRIGREAASQLDLEEALEASRYASHPYSTHPREVSFRNDSTSFN